MTSGPLKGLFDAFYILPTLFDTDLDRGFSIIDYSINNDYASQEDLERLKDSGVCLMTDLILNHISVLSPQFRDLTAKGDKSEYRDFFIDWNAFWKGKGTIDGNGVVQPDPKYLKGMNFRKPGLPYLMVRMRGGREKPYWNTFYQEVIYPRLLPRDLVELTGMQYTAAVRLSGRIDRALDGRLSADKIDFTGFEAQKDALLRFMREHRTYLGQMDLNVQSPKVWEYYAAVMDRVSKMGTRILRLDAFVRLHKAPGRANFMNEPETWDILTKLRGMAQERGMDVLPEIHATYESGAYKKLHALGCRFYDFFLPGLLLDAIYTHDASYLCSWIEEVINTGMRPVTMLGCHDGIPIRDLTGLLPEARREALSEKITRAGGRAKLIHGEKTEVYQMCCTYYSALSCDPDRMGLCRAVQLFMPGCPQVWYMDLFCRENDTAVFEQDPGADAREINRTPLSGSDIEKALAEAGTQRQLRLLKLRRENAAFGPDAAVTCRLTGPSTLVITRTAGDARAELTADFETGTAAVTAC